MLQGEFAHVLLAFGGAIAVTLAYAMGLILPSIWWLSPQYVAPAAVVALQPAIACVDAGLSSVFRTVTEGLSPLLRASWQLLVSEGLRGLE